MRFLVLLPLLLPWVVPASAAAPSMGVGQRADLVVGLKVLREWDALRAKAWAGGDELALRSLYVRGSAAGDADVRLLRDYSERRVVVRRLVTQVFAVRVLRRDATTFRLRVFDRVAGGEVVERGRPARLRSGPPATRDVGLRLIGRSWRVATVSPVSGPVSGWEPGPRGARR